MSSRKQFSDLHFSRLPLRASRDFHEVAALDWSREWEFHVGSSSVCFWDQDPKNERCLYVYIYIYYSRWMGEVSDQGHHFWLERESGLSMGDEKSISKVPPRIYLILIPSLHSLPSPLLVYLTNEGISRACWRGGQLESTNENAPWTLVSFGGHFLHWPKRKEKKGAVLDVPTCSPSFPSFISFFLFCSTGKTSGTDAAVLREEEAEEEKVATVKWTPNETF